MDIIRYYLLPNSAALKFCDQKYNSKNIYMRCIYSWTETCSCNMQVDEYINSKIVLISTGFTGFVQNVD